jgi:hypothetical protein
MTRSLSRPELIAWTRLARTPRIGPLTFHRLIARFRTAAAALDALPRVSNLTAQPEERAHAEIEGVEALGARLIASCETDYPPLLAQLDAPPPVIAVRGGPKWLKRPTIAIVGSREGSGSALLFAERLSADLGQAGFTIVSGLARGVDAAAHRGALATGTVGVLAGAVSITRTRPKISNCMTRSANRARSSPKRRLAACLARVTFRGAIRSSPASRARLLSSRPRCALAHSSPHAPRPIRAAMSWPLPARRSIRARAAQTP